MTPSSRLTALLLLGTFASLHAAENLDVTISGAGADKVKLETFAPPPDIPGPEALSFSLDGGKSAMNAEVIPLAVTEAARDNKGALSPTYGLPTIPSSPYIIQTLPPAQDMARLRKSFQEGKTGVGVMNVTWAFRVLDENNVIVFERTGDGMSPPIQEWDGLTDGKFALDPNLSYNSSIVLVSSPVVQTWPGEAHRFMAVAHEEPGKSILTFGDRLYHPQKATFSDEAFIYLDDVVRRLYLYRGGTADRKTATFWTLMLYEPDAGFGDNSLAHARKRLWKNYLETALGEKIPDNNIRYEPVEGKLSSAVLTIEDAHPLPQPLMHGRAVAPAPQSESKKDWVRIREEKDVMMIEFQHDRLFRTGTAYLRDESLPEVAAALIKVKLEAGKLQPTGKKIRKEDRPNTARPIVLRSYTQRPRDKKRDKFDEDPQLSALRTKALFTLFARARYLP